MPEMSGVELLKAVRQVSPLTAGLIVTAYPESVLAEGSPESQPPPLVAKPWDDETLRVAVRELVGGPDPFGGESGDLLDPGRMKAARVLVPLDGTPEAEAALAAVLPLVRARSMGVELVRVIREMGLHPDIHSYVERTWKALAQAGISAGGRVRWGDPADEILREARHIGAELIALSTDARSPFRRYFREGVGETLLRTAEVPLLLSRPGCAPAEWKRILVPLDGSREAETILPDALRLAKESGALLEVLRVASSSPWAASEFGVYSLQDLPMPYLEEIEKAAASEDIPLSVVALEGYPSWEILRYAERSGAHLICLTTRGRGPLERLVFSSVAEAVIRSSPCPVYVRRIHPPGS
jgi:nucleotide-binding universal stress UspA family protein